MNKRKGPPGLVDWEEAFPALARVHGGKIDLEAVTQDAPTSVRYLVHAHCHGPMELYVSGLNVGIRERDKQEAAKYRDMVDKCVGIVLDNQEEVATWLWSLIR
jgi:hypothetical protein